MDLMELVRKEIYESFNEQVNFNDSVFREFNLHCSKIFSQILFEDFLELGFIMPNDMTKDSLPKAVKYQIPFIGYINLIEEDRIGYEIKLKTD